MRDLDITFEETPWELTLQTLHRGDRLSAARFLTLMEGENEQAMEDALQDLEDRQIGLDVSDLPRPAGTGEAALRLRREAELAQKGDFLTALDENDPLRLYLEELTDIPACADIRVLAEECARGDASARERLLNASLSRAVELARGMTGRGVLLLDLIQEASLGLWQAIAGYTGGDFEVLEGLYEEIFQYIDILIDGRYIDDLRDYKLKWRGSSNQRIIDVQASLKSGNVVFSSENM